MLDRNAFGSKMESAPRRGHFPVWSESVSIVCAILLVASTAFAAIEDLPDIYFFPKDKAQQNGYEVTNKNWRKLTDLQKVMFIIEAIQEIEMLENMKIPHRDTWKLEIALNIIIDDINETHSDLETPVIRILYEQLI